MAFLRVLHVLFLPLSGFSMGSDMNWLSYVVVVVVVCVWLFCMLLLADFFLLSGPDLVVVGWYDRGRIPRAFLYREDGGTESGDRW